MAEATITNGRRFAAVAIYLLVSLAPISCYSKNPPDEIVVRPLPKKNPTTYTFHSPIEQVSAALTKRQFDLVPGLHGMIELKDDSASREAEAIFNKPENQYDGVIANNHGSSTCHSEVYFGKDSAPLLYMADYHIHLKSIDASNTVVEVLTSKSWVYAGEQESSTPVSWHRKGIFVKVAPTTVEEYKMLLGIGSALRIEDMPKLILPDPKAPPQTFRYTEADIVDFSKE